MCPLSTPRGVLGNDPPEFRLMEEGSLLDIPRK